MTNDYFINTTTEYIKNENKICIELQLLKCPYAYFVFNFQNMTSPQVINNAEIPKTDPCLYV